MPAASALPIESFGFAAMGGPCEIRLAHADPAVVAAAAEAASAEIRRIEAKYSRYRADSILSRINAAAGLGWTACDAETVALLGYADQLHAASDGLFDITSGVLRRAWDFARASVPDPATLAPLRGLIGWPLVERRGDEVRLPRPGMEIDFGGFAKEYAADRVAAMILDAGVVHGLVNLGGDLRIVGPQPDGMAWSIAIQDPRQLDRSVAAIDVARGALATSGDYERFFEAGGRRYCHILDPRSAMPVEYWRSVSVLAPLAIVAGSHSTIAMLKQEAGLAYLDAAGVAYLAIDHRGRMHRKDLA